MIFSYNWLQSFFKQKLPKPQKLAEVLTMHAFEVKDVKNVKCQMSNVKCDYVLDIDVTPNRADCFSHMGIAREIAAITKLELKELTFSTGVEKVNQRKKEKENLKVDDFIKIEVKDRNACPRYTARVITDVKVGESPKRVQEKLGVCGLQSINNVVDAVNYVMLEAGQPLHAFDFVKIKSMQIQNPKPKIQNKSKAQNPKFKTILVRRAKKGERITTLDGGRYDLDGDILVIADNEPARLSFAEQNFGGEPLAIAGLKGGKRAEIDDKTKIVVLESANFNPQIIRSASRKLGLKTDASLRFEHGLDPNLTEFAINRAVELIQKTAGGKITEGLVDFYPVRVLPRKIKLDLNYVEKLLGVKISQKEIEKIFKNLGFNIKRKQSYRPVYRTKTKNETEYLERGYLLKTGYLEVEAPTFRQDVSIPEDLVEEIGRFYGYERIRPVLPIASLIPPQKNDKIFWEESIKNILKELNFSEVYNYSFISPQQVSNFRFQVPSLIEVENPVSIEQKYLRPSLIPNLLKNVKFNLNYFKEIRIFEIGKIYKKSKCQNPNCSKSNPKSKIQKLKLKIEEKLMLSGVITGKEVKEGFYEAKGVIDLLLNKLGISTGWYDGYQPTPEDGEITIWHPQRCAEIKIDGEEIGFLGEISPKILEELKLPGVVVFDVDFEKLSILASEEYEYQPISPFPAAIRDLAILVPRDVKVEEVLNRIETAGGQLIRDVDLFDIYEGEELPEGKKNFAFHIIYQAENRTLTGREIDEVHNRIVEELEGEAEWEIRR